MIRVSVSETKNRLSHFIRLVRGGEEIEIMDRNTPVAKIVHIAKFSETGKKATWIVEAVHLGLITPPKKKELPTNFFDRKNTLPQGKGVLQALLQEREEAR
jgi:prevent-host-death family protein